MKQPGRLLAFLALLTAMPSPADYLAGAKTWCGKWRSLQKGRYCVDVNYTGEMGVTVGGVGFGFGQFQSRWREKRFSTHHDLHGKGPWTTVDGKVEEDGDISRVTVSGTIVDMAIVQTLVAGPDAITYRWQGEVIDPTPELDRIDFEGAVYTWKNRELDLPCSAVSTDGRRTAFRLRNDFGELLDVQRLEFEVEGAGVSIALAGVRRFRFRSDKRHTAIPVRFYFQPEGAAHLTPGAVFGYEIKVTLSSAQRKP